jgi:hypothetical protein
MPSSGILQICYVEIVGVPFFWGSLKDEDLAKE